MNGSTLNVSEPPKNMLASQVSRDSMSAIQIDLKYFAFISLVLFSIAIFLAPEEPHHQASICQRYNSAIACRIL